MLKTIIFIILIVMISGCASHKITSEEARKQLDEKFVGRVGSATKAELTEHFGAPSWCRPNETGEESCRFYKKTGTQWVGNDKRDKKSYEAFDEVFADFDAAGKLKKIETNAQR